MERLKSKVVWTAVAALIALLLNNYGLWGYLGMTEDVFMELVNMILAILVMVGILNNPTDKENW